MKKSYFILLLFPLLSAAQQDKFVDIMWGSRFDTTARYIRLPVRNLDFSAFHVDHSRSSSQRVVSSDSVYYKILSRYAKDSLPVFDFGKQELLLRMACTQCIVLCPTPDPCHRNACRYSYSWAIRDKRKD